MTRTQLADTTELLKQAHEDAAEAKSESAATAKENDTLKGRVKELKKMLEDGDQLLRKSKTGIMVTSNLFMQPISTCLWFIERKK